MFSSFVDPSQRPSAERRHTGENLKIPTPPHSRSNSISSITSHKSEPGWLTAMNGIDRSRNSSVMSTTSVHTAPGHPSGSKPSGLKKLFGAKTKEEKEKRKKQSEQLVLTSRHAAAVKTKLALDPKLKQVLRKDSQEAPLVAGTQKSVHLTAHEQQLRHPHSGPPALKPADKIDLPVLTRIISGDEADEPDDFERARDEWRRQKLPNVTMVAEGDVAEFSPPESPEETASVEIPASTVVEHQGVRLLSATNVDLDADQFQPRPSRSHTPIAGRYRRDEKGVWHK